MPKKSHKGASGRGGKLGRKSIASGENPVLEERVEFVADLVAGRRSTYKICQACAERFGLSERQTKEYIAEVKRRWQLERDKTTIAQKKEEILRSLRRVAEKAEERITYGEDGQPRENPDWWLVRQIELDIAKIEGLAEGSAPTDGDLDTIINDLAAERASGNPQAGADRS